ncbi:holocytochrome c synthase [Cystobasidiomycetes sp. EMM_F5]
MGNTSSSPVTASRSPSMPADHPRVGSTSAAAPPAGCPMHEPASQSAASDMLNPLNNIPQLPQSPLSPAQKTALSLERTYSSIPRTSGDGTQKGSASACPVPHGDAKGKGRAVESSDSGDTGSNWVYPSPQQFYNALMRKGKDTPEESVDMMVQIHNFLNEKAWDEIRRWEDRRSPNERLELSKFEGRPEQLSPKARYHLFLGSLFPQFYKHDWHVRRANDGTSQRYVIDYYSCPDDENGMPVFSLDVRPAVDTPGAVFERVSEWARVKKEAWSSPQSSQPPLGGQRTGQN